MAFNLPATFTKVLGKQTERNYKRQLNILADYGFTTVEDLSQYPKQVIEAIQLIVPDDEPSDRHLRRVFLCAIFWVVPNIKDRKNPYHTFWVKHCTPKTNDSEGIAWDPNSKRYKKFLGL